MFLLDSLMISGIRWALETVVTAAEADGMDFPDGGRLPPGQALDKGFLDEHTRGLAELRQAVESAAWENLVEQSGIGQALSGRVDR